MLKITGGEHRGRVLKAPPGLLTRPTASRVREAVFNILGPRVEGAAVADLFAGSGIMGLEALSRGAGRCTFVEIRRMAIRVLSANIASLGLTDRTGILMADAAQPSGKLLDRGPFDLALADPPYGKGFVARLVKLAAAPGFLAPGGLMVLEHHPKEAPPAHPDLEEMDHRVYGQTEITMLRLLEAG